MWTLKYKVFSSDEISFSNPGGFRIDVEVAISGGISATRNIALTKRHG